MIYNYNCNYATTKQLKTTATATTTTARRIAKQEKNPQLTDNNQQQLANSMQNQIFQLPSVATGKQKFKVRAPKRCNWRAKWNQHVGDGWQNGRFQLPNAAKSMESQISKKYLLTKEI